jgi:hypothetical protein
MSEKGAEPSFQMQLVEVHFPSVFGVGNRRLWVKISPVVQGFRRPLSAGKRPENWLR